MAGNHTGFDAHLNTYLHAHLHAHSASGSKSLESAFEPGDLGAARLDGAIDQDHIEAARRQAGQAGQVMASRVDDAPLLERTDAAAGATVAIAAALTNLDKHERAVVLPHDQIDLAPAPARRAKIRSEPAQAASLQMRAGKGLGLIAATLGGGRPAAR